MEDKEFNCLLTASTLILSSDLVADMGVKVGDRIYVEYTVKKDMVFPILKIGMKGNILHKNNSISFKGKENDFLKSYGTTFKCYRIEPKEEGEKPSYKMYGNTKENIIYTSVEKAIEHRSHLSPEVFLNKDFIMPNYKDNNFTF